MLQFPLRRLLLMVPLLGIGSAVLVKGAFLEMQHPRSNQEDQVALLVLAAGASLIGAGVGLLSRQRLAPLVLAVVFPPLGFMILVVLVWGYIIGFAIFRSAGLI
jgi:hypothetical protein